MEIQYLNPTVSEFFKVSLIINTGIRCSTAKRNYGRHEEIIVN